MNLQSSLPSCSALCDRQRTNYVCLRRKSIDRCACANSTVHREDCCFVRENLYNACASSWFFEIMQNMRTGISSKESTALEVSWYLRPALALCPLPCCGRLENVSTWMCRSILDFSIFWWYRVASCSAKLCTQQAASAAKQESNDHHAVAAGWRELAPVTLRVWTRPFKTSWQGREMCRYNTPALANAFHWPMTISNRQIMIKYAVRSTNDKKI